MKGRKKPDIGQLLVSMAVAILLGCQGVLCAAEATPEKLQGVGIAEQLGNSIDLSLPFTEETGKPITLGKYFDGTHPVLLVMAYYECYALWCSMAWPKGCVLSHGKWERIFAL